MQLVFELSATVVTMSDHECLLQLSTTIMSAARSTRHCNVVLDNCPEAEQLAIDEWDVATGSVGTVGARMSHRMSSLAGYQT